ncbi:MAG: hypothetical protein HC902_06865 [Calothrix sp. SM1_5_4]|nr:hypothetical protein [Calothrix sp. SM1_5_4]
MIRNFILAVTAAAAVSASGIAFSVITFSGIVSGIFSSAGSVAQTNPPTQVPTLPKLKLSDPLPANLLSSSPRRSDETTAEINESLYPHVHVEPGLPDRLGRAGAVGGACAAATTVKEVLAEAESRAIDVVRANNPDMDDRAASETARMVGVAVRHKRTRNGTRRIDPCVDRRKVNPVWLSGRSRNRGGPSMLI